MRVIWREIWRLFVLDSLKNCHYSAGMTTKTVDSAALEDFFSPPASVRGSTALNREDFRREVLLPAIRLRDASLCGRFVQRLPHVLLRFPKIKRVINDVGEDGKVRENCIWLAPNRMLGGSNPCGRRPRTEHARRRALWSRETQI